MSWSNPKINWTVNDVIGTSDLNRIETNISLRRGYKDGFNTIWTTGSYLVGIAAGMIDIFSFIYTSAVSWTKSINGSWVAGTGNAGRAAGVALTDNTWYHLFILGKPSTGAIDFAFDSSPLGSNIAVDAGLIAAGFTSYRRIGSFLWFNTTNFFRRWIQHGNMILVAGLHNATTLNTGHQDFYMRYQTGNPSSPLTLPVGVEVLAYVNIANSTGTGLVQINPPGLGVEFYEPIYYERQSLVVFPLYESKVEVTIPSDTYMVLIYCNKYIDMFGADNQYGTDIEPTTTTTSGA